METCEYCGRKISNVFEKKYWLFCDGKLTLGPDPFYEEIHDDHSDYWMCDGQRLDAANDI